MPTAKQQVHDFWNAAACGEQLYLSGTTAADYAAQSRKRYDLEPYILEFLEPGAFRGKRVLEIGVGLGADHECLARAGAELSGIDLTPRAVEHTRRRLAALGLSSNLGVGDAEALNFPDSSFDMVYSWGVLHHSPDTGKAISEVWRVLKPGGTVKAMIYHKWSLVGLMLWTRYALLRLRPWLSMSDIYGRHLESPGTRAFSTAEARALFNGFRGVRTKIVLTHGDLLESGAGQRHEGAWLAAARALWPRKLIRRHLPGWGLFMMITARK